MTHGIRNCDVCGENHCCAIEARKDHGQWKTLDVEIVDETDRKYVFNGDEADDVWVDKP